MTRPQDLTPTQYTVLLYMINPANWLRADKNDSRYVTGELRPPTGYSLSKAIGWKGAARAHYIVAELRQKGYLDTDLKATEKCNGMNKTLTMKG